MNKIRQVGRWMKRITSSSIEKLHKPFQLNVFCSFDAGTHMNGFVFDFFKAVALHFPSMFQVSKYKLEILFAFMALQLTV